MFSCDLHKPQLFKIINHGLEITIHTVYLVTKMTLYFSVTVNRSTDLEVFSFVEIDVCFIAQVSNSWNWHGRGLRVLHPAQGLPD